MCLFLEVFNKVYLKKKKKEKTVDVVLDYHRKNNYEYMLLDCIDAKRINCLFVVSVNWIYCFNVVVVRSKILCNNFNASALTFEWRW